MFELNTDVYFMQQAFREAEKAYELGEVPVGAVVVADNYIIGRGHNYVERLNDVTAHAEIIAITSASEYLGSKYLNECSIFITLEPCVMCAGAIMHARFSRVIYGASDISKGYTNIHQPILHKDTEVTSGILNEECGKILTKFFKEQREKKN